MGLTSFGLLYYCQEPLFASTVVWLGVRGQLVLLQSVVSLC